MRVGGGRVGRPAQGEERGGKGEAHEGDEGDEGDDDGAHGVVLGDDGYATIIATAPSVHSGRSEGVCFSGIGLSRAG